MRRAIATRSAFALLCVTRTADAQHTPEETEARRHFARGVALTDDGDFGGAMAEFSRSYELTRNPSLLFNLAVVHEGMRHWAEALTTLQRFVDEAPPAAVRHRRADVDATLARLRERVGTLVVTLDTADLVVEVDGLPRPSADDGLRLDVGRHRVRLSAPGHIAREAEVDVPGGARVEITEPLERTRSTLSVACNVAGAEVLVDGHTAATTPVSSPIAVPEGEHRVELRRPGYTAFSTVVEARGIGASVRAELAWATPVPDDQGARLNLRVSETGAAAFLDERRFSFDGSERVPAGPHLLRVTRRDFLPWETDIDLPAGATITRAVALRPTSLYREEYLSNARRARTVAWVIAGSGAALTLASVAAIALGVDGAARTETQQDTVDRSLTACRLGASTCSPAELESLRAEVDALPRDLDQYRALTGVGVAAGVIGIGGVVAGAVLLARAPSMARFASWTASPSGTSLTLRF